MPIKKAPDQLGWFFGFFWFLRVRVPFFSSDNRKTESQRIPAGRAKRAKRSCSIAESNRNRNPTGNRNRLLKRNC